MMSYLVESVVLSFTIGGIVGALVALHLTSARKATAPDSQGEGELVRVRIRRD